MVRPWQEQEQEQKQVSSVLFGSFLDDCMTFDSAQNRSKLLSKYGKPGSARGWLKSGLGKHLARSVMKNPWVGLGKRRIRIGGGLDGLSAGNPVIR